MLPAIDAASLTFTGLIISTRVVAGIPATGEGVGVGVGTGVGVGVGVGVGPGVDVPEIE